MIGRMEETPQLDYQILTKDLNFYQYWTWPENCWLGVTVTNQREFDAAYVGMIPHLPRKNFISMEPLHGPIKIPSKLRRLDWLIVGAETGNRCDRIRPAWEWVNYLVYIAGLRGVPIFLKDNLIKELPGIPQLQQFPEAKNGK